MAMIHEITSAVPRYRRRLRKGRGESSGHGKTCGRGTKGSGARVGKPINPGHEGGQTRIYRRLPKRGFSNDPFAHEFHVVNIADLARFADGTTVDTAALVEAGLVPDARYPVKILGDGELTRKLTVQAGWYSKSAYAKITAGGGSALTVDGKPFEFPKPKKRFVPRPKETAKKEKPGKDQAPSEAEAAPKAQGEQAPSAQ